MQKKGEGMQVKFLRRMKNVKEGFSSSLRSLRKGRAAAAATENPLGDYPSPFSAKLVLGTPALSERRGYGTDVCVCVASAEGRKHFEASSCVTQQRMHTHPTRYLQHHVIAT